MDSCKAQVTSAVEWLSNEVLKCSFGEIGIKFVIHDGRISCVEREIIQKHVPGAKAGETDERR
jgi:hypothetical protein